MRTSEQNPAPAALDALLLFPPTTEAFFFPYLSLPRLTAYLRARGYAVLQRDLNLELAERLFSSERLAEYCERGAPADLPSQYRLALARYLGEVCPSMRERIFLSKTADSNDLRFLRQAVALLQEESILNAQVHSLDAAIACAAGFEAANDRAAELLRDMLDADFAQPAPRVVGISVAFHSQLVTALLLARWARQACPQALVVLGGPQLMLHGPTLISKLSAHRWVDAVVTGPGEQALAQLVELARGRGTRQSVVETWWRERPEQRPPRTTVSIRDVPPPDFDDLPIERYLSNEVQLALTTCVGCSWGHCTFCLYGNRSRLEHDYQQCSPEQIAHACAVLVKKYNIKRINFVDENTNLRLVMSALKRLEVEGIRIRWSARSRLERGLTDPDFCLALAALGCVSLSCGYEGVSQRLLDNMQRGVDARDYSTSIENLHAAGIAVRLSVMGGLPQETPEEAALAEDFLLRHRGMIGIDSQELLVVEPGSLLARTPTGLSLRDDGHMQGNEVLSFGMGRMGISYEHTEGESVALRLERMVAFYERFGRASSDPEALRGPKCQSVAARSATPVALRLHPWIAVLSADDGTSVFADLLWQRFYQSAALELRDDRTLPAHSFGTDMLQQFADRDLGVLIHLEEVA